jgi:hypothetical protein
VSHAAPERASIETGAMFSSTGRHGGRRRAVRGSEARFGQLPYVAVTVGVGIALLIISQGVHFVRSGTLVLAGVLLIAAMARLVLPERRAGLLSSRRRLLDVAILGALGIGLLVAGLVVPVPR